MVANCWADKASTRAVRAVDEASAASPQPPKPKTATGERSEGTLRQRTIPPAPAFKPGTPCDPVSILTGTFPNDRRSASGPDAGLEGQRVYALPALHAQTRCRHRSRAQTYLPNQSRM